MTIAEQTAFEKGQALRRVTSPLSESELDAAAEAYALEYCGEPAGRSSVRYDAYAVFFACKDWFKAGYNRED